MKRRTTNILDYVVFIINYLRKRRFWGTKEVLYWYHYFNHLIQLWPGDWVKQIAKINEVVGMKNRFTMDGGGKRLVRPFKSKYFWKFIGCILSEVAYGKKGHKLWSEIPKASCRMAPTKIRRYVSGNTDLYKIFCAHYRHFYIYACHLIILSYTTPFIYWMFL